MRFHADAPAWTGPNAPSAGRFRRSSDFPVPKEAAPQAAIFRVLVLSGAKPLFGVSSSLAAGWNRSLVRTIPYEA